MAILLIIGLVFGMMCWVAWENIERRTIRLPRFEGTITSVSVINLKTGVKTYLEWRHVPVIYSRPTCSAADNLELRIGIKRDDTNNNE